MISRTRRFSNVWLHTIDRKAQNREEGRPRPGVAFHRSNYLNMGGHHLSAEVIAQKPKPEFSVRFHAGNLGSETPFDAHLTVAGTGVYLGTTLGRRAAHILSLGEKTYRGRKLYGGRDLSLALHNGRLWWHVWTDPTDWSRGRFAGWRERSLTVNPADILLGGPKRGSHEDVAGTEAVIVLPEGEQHLKLTLRRATWGRPKGRKDHSWNVDWSATPGISVRPDDGWKGPVTGSSVNITDQQAAGDWAAAAMAALHGWVKETRARYGYKPEREAA